MNYEIGLYKHNASAYQKVKNEFNKKPLGIIDYEINFSNL